MRQFCRRFCPDVAVAFAEVSDMLDACRQYVVRHAAGMLERHEDPARKQ
eukprot:SAG11_NODE_9361_length_919_cov_0.875610_1_plen_48_part_10